MRIRDLAQSLDIAAARHVNRPDAPALADNAQYRALMAKVRCDVDLQRAEVARIDTKEDFIATFAAASSCRPHAHDPSGVV